MSGDDTQKRPSAPPSREERLARALRENLGRRKELVRAKRARADDTQPTAESSDDPADGEACP